MSSSTLSMVARALSRPSRLPRQFVRSRPFNAAPKRTLIAAPTPTSGPLMERRADRELPEVQSSSRKWLTTLPIFFAIIAGSSLAIFNYQKSSSSTVNSTLYALRTSPQAREILGDEIYFRDRFPWISGELNQLHGRIDIGFGVKGKKGRGYMRFRAFRKTRMGYFNTEEWSLETDDGRIISLLHDNIDPFKNSALEAEPRQ